MIGYSAMKHLTVILILLASLTLAALNTNVYIRLFRESPCPVPEHIVDIRGKCLHLESLEPDSMQILTDLDIKQIADALKVKPFVKKKKPAVKIRKSPARQTRRVSRKLPKLSGIIWSFEPGNEPRGIALMGNLAVERGETINGFTVENIDQKGVTLSISGKKWFLKLPEVAFSKCSGN